MVGGFGLGEGMGARFGGDSHGCRAWEVGR